MKPTKPNNDPASSSKNSTDSNSDKPSAEAQVIRWMVSGETLDQIDEALASIYPSVDKKKVLSTASRYFAKACDEPWRSVMGWCICAARDVHKRSLECGDHALALASIKEISRLATTVRKESEQNNDHSIEL